MITFSKFYQIYSHILEEGIDEKIPKLMPMIKSPSIISGFKISGENTKVNFIHWVADNFDPTPNKEYLTWLIKILSKENFRGLEDSYKIRESLEKFTELKNKKLIPVEHRDINRFKRYLDLVNVVSQFSGVTSKKENIRIKTENGITHMGSMGGYDLYVVTSKEAAAKHFRNTEWCVRDPRAWDNYDPELYYFFTKNGTPNTLIHFSSNQVMDVQDVPAVLDSSEIHLLSLDNVVKFILDNEPISSYPGMYRMMKESMPPRLLKYALKIYPIELKQNFKDLTDDHISKMMEMYFKPPVLGVTAYNSDDVEESYNPLYLFTYTVYANYSYWDSSEGIESQIYDLSNGNLSGNINVVSHTDDSMTYQQYEYALSDEPIDQLNYTINEYARFFNEFEGQL